MSARGSQEVVMASTLEHLGSASLELTTLAETPRPRHFSLVRSMGPGDVLTLGNLGAGTAAIFLCLSALSTGDSRRLWLAFALLPVAGVFDVLDGLAARRFHSSRLGADLDSLADIVSFGVAPAVLGYTLGLRSGLDVALLLGFVACGALRLARYNVTHEALSGPNGKVAYYEGAPITASLLLVGAMALVTGLGGSAITAALALGPLTLHPFALVFAVGGTAMISATLRIPKP